MDYSTTIHPLSAETMAEYTETDTMETNNATTTLPVAGVVTMMATAMGIVK